jgi:diaminohydroxyphosphoribosylaminopyrimidine deaminase/5-amino-6-(5-phosphoribosylamino)uracil reductase
LDHQRIFKAIGTQMARREQAILVGTQTVVDDNPILDVRDWTGENPTRIVLDQNNRISKESHIFGNRSKTLVYSELEISVTTWLWRLPGGCTRTESNR